MDSGDKCCCNEKLDSVLGKKLSKKQFRNDLGETTLYPPILCADRDSREAWGIWGPSRSLSEALFKQGPNVFRWAKELIHTLLSGTRAWCLSFLVCIHQLHTRVYYQ